MGIGKELFIFLLAVLAGAIVRLAYRCISCLREVVHHAHWVIELEGSDLLDRNRDFFVCADLLTSSGSVRWYFILGVGIGGIIMSVFLAITGKICRKIVRRHSRFFTETLEKPGEKR